MALLERVLDTSDIHKVYISSLEQRKQYSNCYSTGNEFEGLCLFYKYKSGFLMVINKRGYYRLCFCTDDLYWINDLQQIKSDISDNTIVIEIVSRYEVNPLSGLLNYQKRYSRYRQLGASPISDVEPVCYCSHQDARQVKDLMYNSFSPIGNELPTESEIDNAIANKNVICIKNKDNLCGYLIFEDKGKTSYLRNICVSEIYRSMGIGRRLLDMYHGIHNDYKVFTLWCDDQNQAALTLYCGHHLGGGTHYENECLHNYIYIC